MSTKSLNEWLHWIKNYHDQAINYNLDNIQRVATALDLCNFSIPVITVAGTNGKGTCVASMEAILIAHGYKVGSYTSPHMFHFTERIKINSVPVNETDLCAAMQVIHDFIVHNDYLPLSYFEFATAAALWIFKHAQLDFLLLEVGLGGRLDAVNVVNNDVAVVTSVSLDHCAYLGNTREAIGHEKAGIFKPDKHAVYAEPLIPNTVLQHAKQQGTKLHLINEDYRFQNDQQGWSWYTEKHTYENLPRVNFPVQNAAAALQALHLLPSLQLQGSIIKNGLRNLQVIGRFQVEQLHGKEFIFDVAHNPDAVAWLANKLNERGHSGNTVVILAIVATKDCEEMLKAWHYPVTQWLLCAPESMRRATSVEQLAAVVGSTQNGKIIACEDVRQAFYQADAITETNDRIVIFGSFHTVSQALSIFKNLKG